MQPSVENFSTNAVAPSDREDYWQAIASTTHLPVQIRLGRPAEEFSSAVVRRWFGDIAVVDATCKSCHGERTSKLIGGDEQDRIGIIFSLSGEERITSEDDRLVLRQNDFAVWDSERRFQFEISNHMRKRTLLINRSAIEEAGGRSWSTKRLVQDSMAPSVRLLRSYLETLSTLPGELSAQSIVAARNAALELVAGTVRTEITMSTALAGEALRSSVDRWTDRNLATGNVSPAAAAVAHSVSVRTLHRCYAAAGTTFGKIVRARRLERARQDLVTALDSVQIIADRWGFADAAHFSRAFKQHYGLSPSDYRNEPSPRSNTLVPKVGTLVHE